ncbi:hypothetical protein ABW20_dc0101040 [Dactylellina cionopaga]|nr:hypothetical protein ABW20_dc0101040 [Dactylellina cionopaga]
MPYPFGSIFSSKKDNASDGSTSPTPHSKSSKKSRDKSYGMSHIQDYTSREDPRSREYRLRSQIDPRSNGQFIDMHTFGYPTHGEPEFIRSRLMAQLQETLNAKLNEGVRKACLHWDDEVLHLENNYQTVLEERNGLRTENKNLANRVKTLEKEVNEKVALLQEFHAGHMKSAGTRRLPPSSSAISTEYESLERRVRDMVFGRLARLNLKHDHILKLLEHRPFLDAVKNIMVDEEEAKDADNLPMNLLGVVEDSEKKSLLMFIIQGVIHDVLHKKVMCTVMPGLDEEEAKFLHKIYEVIAYSEGEQGVKYAQEWRADTFRRLAFWADKFTKQTDNFDELEQYIKASPAVAQVAQVFQSVIGDTEQTIVKVLEPLCDPDTTEGQNFRRLISDVVDKAFAFSILIGSQTSRYQVHRNVNQDDDFKAVPEQLEEPSSDKVSLFYAVPALIKSTNEEGEAYEVPELLVQGKLYVLFGIGGLIEEEEEEEEGEQGEQGEEITPVNGASESAKIKMASPVNGDEIFESIENGSPEIIGENGAGFERPPPVPEKIEVEPRGNGTESSANTYLEGADTVLHESNPSMTEFSEIIIPVQELIVITTCKETKESSEGTPNENSGATATTTSNNNEIDTLRESTEITKDQSPLPTVDLATSQTENPNRGVSTTTSPEIPSQQDIKNLNNQHQSTQKTLEALPRSELLSPENKYQSLEAHLSEAPASPKDNLSPLLLQSQEPQTVILPLDKGVNTNPGNQTQAQATAEASPPAAMDQVVDPVPQATPKDFTATVLATLQPAVEEASSQTLQPPSETQTVPSVAPIQSSTPQAERTSLPEPKLPRLPSSSNPNSVAQSTPRTLPAGPVNLLSSSDDSKSPKAVIQEKAAGVETVV